ncbi:LysE family translocator [Pseudoalteromonas sp. C2R02]|uniref:LysE family translocator n=1 Tax=Pseudoalteromonas sp. C2R02 TaxID=2841565 RepID=UPI001C08465B|nr:LysE family translocator [Pseudoalteromonas sp. C2R02]MBU2970814.1 LysE family translocator [Pseudoalteromonas sp. C2R02]
MIDISVLPLFFTAVFFLVISPGPDLILISSYSSTKRFKAGLLIALGIFFSGILQTLLVAFGLGQLMQAMPIFAFIIKIVGALYLAYLGINMLRAWYQNNYKDSTTNRVHQASNLQLINKGFLNNLLNPKALLFFSLFLPQFTTGSAALSVQIIILGALLSLVGLISNTIFALSFSQFARLIGNKFKLGRHIDGLLGFIFLGLATRLATSK